MKKIIDIIILISILVFISCTQETVKGTVWKGEIDNLDIDDRDIKDVGKIECYFNPDNTMKVYIKCEIDGGWKFSYTCKGDYTIDYNNKLSAKLNGKGGNKFSFEMTGDINNFTGNGRGEYKWEDDDKKIEGNWILSKVKSY